MCLTLTEPSPSKGHESVRDSSIKKSRRNSSPASLKFSQVPHKFIEKGRLSKILSPVSKELIKQNERCSSTLSSIENGRELFRLCIASRWHHGASRGWL